MKIINGQVFLYQYIKKKAGLVQSRGEGYWLKVNSGLALRKLCKQIFFVYGVVKRCFGVASQFVYQILLLFFTNLTMSVN